MPCHAGGPDLGGAYLQGHWSLVHQQWCVLLNLEAVLLRSLGQYADVERYAVDLLTTAEARLLAACFPPEGTSRQPLTLAALMEMERSLLLLTHLARHRGAWQLALPQSLSLFRSNIAAFVEFAAQPSVEPQCVVHCPPQVTCVFAAFIMF